MQNTKLKIDIKNFSHNIIINTSYIKSEGEDKLRKDDQYKNDIYNNFYPKICHNQDCISVFAKNNDIKNECEAKIVDRNQKIFLKPSNDNIKKQIPEHNMLRAIWRSVITQALMDAANNSNKNSEKKYKQQAIEWLTSFSEDFTTVCELADMDPKYVIQEAYTAMMRGCKWRNDGRLDIAVY